MTMTKGDKIWIVAEYHEDDPADVVQIGMYRTEQLAAKAAEKWAYSRQGTKWITVVFVAEVQETMH